MHFGELGRLPRKTEDTKSKDFRPKHKAWLTLGYAKPSDLPIQRSGNPLVINLNTAETLRLTVPLLLLATADKVIE